MRALIIAATLISASPAEACHRYSVWRYPWAQHCGFHHAGVAKPVNAAGLKPAKGDAFEAPPMRVQVPPPAPPIPLPELSPVAGVWAEGETAGRLFLHAILGP